MRFALHSGKPLAWANNLSTRCHDKPCRGSLLVLPNNGGFGYRLPELKLPDPNDSAKRLLVALQDCDSTGGVV